MALCVARYWRLFLLSYFRYRKMCLTSHWSCRHFLHFLLVFVCPTTTWQFDRPRIFNEKEEELALCLVYGESPTRFYLADSLVRRLDFPSSRAHRLRFFRKAHILLFPFQEETEFTEFIPLLALFLVSLSSVKGHQTAKGNIHPHANFQRSYAKGKKKRAFSISFSKHHGQLPFQKLLE